MKLQDGHIHTPFCPHGSKDSFLLYIERAIKLDYTEISFMEHAPLPASFTDPTPDQDSGMDIRFLEEYLHTISSLKNTYKKDLKINTGLEVDYIEGFEHETAAFLNRYGPHLDDSILSVHFLLKDGKYDCMDYSHEVFSSMAERYGSVDAVHKAYYRTLQLSIEADLGIYKPKRIGHMTLARKFQQLFHANEDYSLAINAILTKIKEEGYELDYNGAGAVKPHCREPYPSADIAQIARTLGIKLVYGSDAHQAKDLHQGRAQLIPPFSLL
ncbi:histidinol-phosphatase HisJ [Jeotgalibacillus proteolyticus]|uniref:Histidinol-phosphatase n=1 Tax=Jeotgalibacillus proteolyticus TaxID=2082395 RepID=A0A2S5GF26_9BACL|nr:histidinol-phosphatase HisJ [Jeotgalibacillus proteolyticus]PPA71652.1 histidinol-phosphatase [Jeotgalibacillus proteolyticus]